MVIIVVMHVESSLIVVLVLLSGLASSLSFQFLSLDLVLSFYCGLSASFDTSLIHCIS